MNISLSNTKTGQKNIIPNVVNIDMVTVNIKNYRDNIYNSCYTVPRIESIKKDMNQYFYSLRVKHEEFAGKRIIKHEYNPVVSTSQGWLVPIYAKQDIEYILNKYQIKCNFAKLNSNVIKPLPLNRGFNIDLWENKVTLVKEIQSRLLSDHGCTLNLGTGKGKTIIVAKTIQLMNIDKVIVFVINETLQLQMRDDIERSLNEKVFLIGGKGRTKADKQAIESLPERAIVVCIARSGYLRLMKEDSFFDQFGFAIYDECDCFCSDKNRSLITRICPDYKLALSATVTKYWNHRLIFDCCGPMLNGNDYIASDTFKTEVRLVRYSGHPEYTHKVKNKSGNMCSMGTDKLLGGDDYRCKLLINLISDLVKEGHNVLVLASVNEVTMKLYDLFTQEQISNGLVCGYINEKTNREDDVELKKDVNVLFTTYSSGSRGFNVPQLTALVLATSFVTNGTQISGRILRGEYKPEKKRVYVDLIDVKSPVARRAPGRMETWKFHNCDIKKIEVSWKDFISDLSTNLSDL